MNFMCSVLSSFRNNNEKIQVVENLFISEDLLKISPFQFFIEHFVQMPIGEVVSNSWAFGKEQSIVRFQICNALSHEL